MEKAKVHSFESFGTVDGPGIRFVIFFQGCPLKCKYCHNRDLWEMEGGQEFTHDELIEEIQKYKPYFEPSGGGITVTGGEPLLQARFIAELFKRCRDVAVNTALDTSGCIPINESIQKLLKYTDLVLLDIKHIDEDAHKDLTGVSNKNTLDFAKYLSENSIPVWIRYVVVPGYTSESDDVYKMAEFLKTLNNVEKVELLPYHAMGEHKWELMDKEYELKGVEAPSVELLEQIKSVFEIRGINATYSI